MALVEASVEGRIEPNSVAPFGAGGVSMRTMGITVQFEPGTTTDPYPEPPPDGPKLPRRKTISTPQGELTPAQLADRRPLPGRAAAGFEGGTVIADGYFDTDAGVLLAEFLAVEPGETVVLGALTRNDPPAGAGGQRRLAVNRMAVEMLTDDRLASDPDNPAVPVFVNQYGFRMRVETAALSPLGPNPVQAPAATSVEGYFSETSADRFHAFLFEYGETGALLDDPAVTPQVAMERAEYRDRGAQVEFDVRGAVTTAHQAVPSPLGQDVHVFRVDGGAAGEVETELGRADIDPQEPGFERWRFRLRAAKPGGIQAGVPLRIVARNLSSPNQAEDSREPDRVVD